MFIPLFLLPYILIVGGFALIADDGNIGGGLLAIVIGAGWLAVKFWARRADGEERPAMEVKRAMEIDRAAQARAAGIISSQPAAAPVLRRGDHLAIQSAGGSSQSTPFEDLGIGLAPESTGIEAPSPIQVEIVGGDIATVEADVIVNAAKKTLMGGGGVDDAIHTAGGPAISEACARLRAEQYPEGLPTGQAVATTAGNLPATLVVHTVGPVYSESEDRDPLLASCYRESIRLANGIGAQSISFPAISTGVYGYPLERAARVAIQAVLAAPTGSVRVVRFVLYSDESLAAFERVAVELGLGRAA